MGFFVAVFIKKRINLGREVTQFKSAALTAAKQE